jgi:hypothetical protein
MPSSLLTAFGAFGSALALVALDFVAVGIRTPENRLINRSHPVRL